MLVQKQAEVERSLSVEDHFNTLLDLIEALPGEEQTAKLTAMARRLMQGKAVKLVISEAWDTWMSTPKKRVPQESTLEGYGSQWRRFESWAKQHKITYLHDVTPAHAQKYAANLWKSRVSPGTFNAHVKFLKSLFNVLETSGGLVSNPWRKVTIMELDQEHRRNLSPDELKGVCSMAEGDLRYMFGLGLYTGMRLGDVINLKWSNVDLNSELIEHMPSKTKRKKKIVRLPIHPVLRALLLEFREGATGEYLFPVEREEYIKNRSGITKRIRHHFEKCGIQTTEEPTNSHRRRVIVRAGFHSLRHSFVSLCAANRVPQVAIMELVGHGSPAMTALYSHAGDEQKAEAIAALPVIGFDNGGADS